MSDKEPPVASLRPCSGILSKKSFSYNKLISSAE